MNTTRALLLIGFGLIAAVVARATERPVGPLSLDSALRDAYTLAARYEGAEVVRVQGVSMLPYFGDGSVLVMKPLSPERLRTGMVVVYRNRFGEVVSHRLEGQDTGGWIVRGYNNDEEDSTRVTADNLMGVVYATFYSNGRLDDELAMSTLVEQTGVVLAAPAR